MLKSWILGLAIATSMAAPAQAAWHKAESAHFVVYADDSERDVQRFAEILERYHAAMKLMTGREDVVPSPSNRVTIFAVGSASTIDRLVGQKNSQIAGFYIPRAGGSRAFVPSIRLNASGETDFSLTVLLHEYAHHFLMATSRHEMPRWYNEGAAEFYASAKFERDGTVGIGRPAYHRAAEITYARDVKVEELLDRSLYEKKHGKGYDAFYGCAWALYHYLIFEETRRGQLASYFRAIVEGKGEPEAAKAFGDLAVLEKDLDRYLERSRVNSFRFTPDRLPIGAVKVSALSAGEGAVMPLVIRSQRGVNREEALKLVTELQAVATRFPEDPGVQTALAEGEFDAGNDAAAIVAADKAIARDPARVNAYVQKGYALFRQAGEAPSADSAKSWQAAMLPFQALNKIENDHPLPLIYYYRSFTERGREPSETARHALERASQLAPFDQGLAFQTALMQAGEGKIALAKVNLMTLAANPHGGELATQARKLADEIGALKEGTPWTGPAIASIELAEVDGEDEGT